MTDVLIVDPIAPDPQAIARAADRLRAGQLVAFPTETVYGLGVDALDRDAVRRLFSAKGRPATDPLIVHVSSVDAIVPLVIDIPGEVRRLAARFWPGPLTMVLRRSARVPDEVTAGLETVAVRVPRHPVARAILDAAAIPIAAPSANLFSRPSPTSAAHVLEDLAGRIDLIVDAGPTSVGVESTVLDLTSAIPMILRPGAITGDMLREVLATVEEYHGPARTGAQRAPGLLEKHYSPRTPLTLYEGADAVGSLLADARVAVASGKRLGLLVAPGDLEHDQPLAHASVVRELGPDSTDLARRLYSSLRELDAAGVDEIYARTFSRTDGLADAVADRLRRAAAGRVVRR